MLMLLVVVALGSSSCATPADYGYDGFYPDYWLGGWGSWGDGWGH
jgi:hypothetical protein